MLAALAEGSASTAAIRAAGAELEELRRRLHVIADERGDQRPTTT